MKRFALVAAVTLIAVIGQSSRSPAAEASKDDKDDIRQDIVAVVLKIAEERKLGGYDAKRRYTQDLKYGDHCCLKSTRPLANEKPNPTMCVAAVTEVMVEALNHYGQRTHDWSFQQKFPVSRLDGDNKTKLLPYIFKYAGADSAGAPYGFERLGLGKQLPFQTLRKGDFITFNRTSGTGHAVIFMGFLESGSTNPKDGFSKTVVGFRYFSAQGEHRADGGMGYRNAYFRDKCPTPRGLDDDCNIIGLTVRADGTVSQAQGTFNTGELLPPTKWTADQALAKLRQDVTRGFEEDGLEPSRGLEERVETELSKSLVPDPSIFVDGTK